MTDPRREDDNGEFTERGSGVHRIPAPVKPKVDDDFSRLVVSCEQRRDLIFVEILESLASLHQGERERRKELQAREETLEEERRDMLNRLQQIAGVVRDHSNAMGQVVQGLESIKRCLGKVETTVELVRQQQQAHGKELARVGGEVRGLSDHFEVAMRSTQKTVHTNEERLDRVESLLSELSERVDAVFAMITGSGSAQAENPSGSTSGSPSGE